MSESPTLVTAEHFDYIRQRTTPEEPLLAELKDAAREAGIPAIWINPEQASLVQILLRLVGARRVVEVGTLAGYSALAMARALPPDGLLDTIELEPKHADFAETWIDKAGLSERVIVHRGAGAEVLAGLETGLYDAAFLDADKASYPIYLEESLRLVRPGGLIMVDNAFAFGQLFHEQPTDPEAEAVKAFNEVMAADTRLASVIVPMGDGMWAGVKISA